MKEIIPEQADDQPDDQIDGQMNLEDILAGWDDVPDPDAGEPLTEEDEFEEDIPEAAGRLWTRMMKTLQRNAFRRGGRRRSGCRRSICRRSRCEEPIKKGETEGENMEEQKTKRYEPILRRISSG